MRIASSHRDSSMTQKLLHRDQIDACPNETGGKGVAQVVEPDVFYARKSNPCPETFLQVRNSGSNLAIAGEDQFRVPCLGKAIGNWNFCIAG